MFEFALAYQHPDGTNQVMLSGSMHAVAFPFSLMKVGELQRWLPGLVVITLDHQITELRFGVCDVKLRGTPVEVRKSEWD